MRGGRDSRAGKTHIAAPNPSPKHCLQVQIKQSKHGGGSRRTGSKGPRGHCWRSSRKVVQSHGAVERVEKARLARLLRNGCAFRLELESPWVWERVLSGLGCKRLDQVGENERRKKGEECEKKSKGVRIGASKRHTLSDDVQVKVANRKAASCLWADILCSFSGRGSLYESRALPAQQTLWPAQEAWSLEPGSLRRTAMLQH